MDGAATDLKGGGGGGGRECCEKIILLRRLTQNFRKVGIKGGLPTIRRIRQLPVRQSVVHAKVGIKGGLTTIRRIRQLPVRQSVVHASVERDSQQSVVRQSYCTAEFQCDNVTNKSCLAIGWRSYSCWTDERLTDATDGCNVELERRSCETAARKFCLGGALWNTFPRSRGGVGIERGWWGKGGQSLAARGRCQQYIDSTTKQATILGSIDIQWAKRWETCSESVVTRGAHGFVCRGGGGGMSELPGNFSAILHFRDRASHRGVALRRKTISRDIFVPPSPRHVLVTAVCRLRVPSSRATITFTGQLKREPPVDGDSASLSHLMKPRIDDGKECHDLSLLLSEKSELRYHCDELKWFHDDCKESPPELATRAAVTSLGRGARGAWRGRKKAVESRRASEQGNGSKDSGCCRKYMPYGPTSSHAPAMGDRYTIRQLEAMSREELQAIFNSVSEEEAFDSVAGGASYEDDDVPVLQPKASSSGASPVSVQAALGISNYDLDSDNSVNDPDFVPEPPAKYPNFHVSRIASVMSLRRYLEILCFLHLSDNEKMPEIGTPTFDKLYKLSNVGLHMPAEGTHIAAPRKTQKEVGGKAAVGYAEKGSSSAGTMYIVTRVCGHHARSGSRQYVCQRVKREENVLPGTTEPIFTSLKLDVFLNVHRCVVCKLRELRFAVSRESESESGNPGHEPIKAYYCRTQKGPRWCSGQTTRLQPRPNRVRFPAGSLLNLRMWESCRTIPLVGGSSRGSSASPPPPNPAPLHADVNHPDRLSRPRGNELRVCPSRRPFQADMSQAASPPGISRPWRSGSDSLASGSLHSVWSQGRTGREDGRTFIDKHLRRAREGWIEAFQGAA
ncbi:hypothetical protein PR048_025491 [Dryococelus australis]|uniref:Uncharacterized protein n=1 Tax=Dryococelus australis TaxID=614101 RepID=A0ABQ9GRH1_9NEOP|nr:hypothetical protein PR048_025491 [Dryococelus australis]